LLVCSLTELTVRASREEAALLHPKALAGLLDPLLLALDIRYPLYLLS